MSRKYLLLGILLLVFILGALTYLLLPPKKVLAPVVNLVQNNLNTTIVDKSDWLVVEQPVAASLITSPVVISGQARGMWFFEGSFPVFLTDANNQIIAQGIATSTQDWMTKEFIPFTATLYFERPLTETGNIILKKDNPSGLPEYDDQLIWPIKFDQQNMTLQVFFTNENTGGETDFDCNDLQAVSKTVPYTLSTARAALTELLKGPSSADRAQGLSTSLNPNIKINSLTIESGIAKVDFNEQLEYQVGGSCRVSTIREQITKTLKQFDTVQTVIISIDGRTEDILQP